MRIGIDIDGVLADFNTAFIPYYIDVTGHDQFPERPFDIPVWDYPQFYGYSDVEDKEVWKRISEDRSFWGTLPPYADIHRSANALLARETAGDDLYFITSRPGVNAKAQTEWWLSQWMPVGRNTVLISSQKGLCARALDLDAYIDDRDRNIFDVVTTHPKTSAYILDRPWNRTPNVPLGAHRVKSVEEFLSLAAPEPLPEWVYPA